MKPSHFHTPRSLGDATFSDLQVTRPPAADIRFNWGDLLTLALVAVALISAGAFVMGVL